MKKAALPCSTKKWKKGIFIIHDGLCHLEKRIDIFRELTKGWYKLHLDWSPRGEGWKRGVFFKIFKRLCFLQIEFPSPLSGF